jgi:ribosomal protein S18 acetylase RimI-like enzyme
VNVREYANADEPHVVALWETCALTRPWNDPRRDIARKLAVADGGLLVGEIDGRIVATVMVGYDGHRGWVNYLAVEPTSQRDGFGRCMMDAAEAWLSARGCAKLNLQVRAGNTAALAFYERLGFSVDEAVSMGKRLESDEGTV